MGICSSIQENIVYPNQINPIYLKEDHVHKFMLVLGEKDFTYNVETKEITRIYKDRIHKYDNASNASANNIVFELGGCGPPQEKTVEGVEFVQYLNFDSLELGWQQATPMPFKGFHMAATSLEGKLYTFGGIRQKKSSTIKPKYIIKLIHVYDILTSRWSCCGKMAVPRYYHTSVACNGKIYSFGGNSRFGSDITDIECFDPATGLSQVVSEMPLQIDDPCVVQVKGMFYILGSDVMRNTRRIFLMFDPTEHRWFNIKSEMNNGRSSLSACVVGDKICTIGGFYNASPNIEVFDPKSGKWVFDQSTGSVSWVDWKRQRVVPI